MTFQHPKGLQFLLSSLSQEQERPCNVEVVNVHEGPELSLPGGLAPLRDSR